MYWLVYLIICQQASQGIDEGRNRKNEYVNSNSKGLNFEAWEFIEAITRLC